MLNIVTFTLLTAIHMSKLPHGVSGITSQKIVSTIFSGAPVVNYNVLLGFEEDVSGQAVEIFYKFFSGKLSECALTDKTLTFYSFIIEKPSMPLASMNEVIQAAKDLQPIFFGGSKLNVEFENILKGENITYYDIFTAPMDFSFSAINYVLQRTFNKNVDGTINGLIVHSELSRIPTSYVAATLTYFNGMVQYIFLKSDTDLATYILVMATIITSNVENIVVFANADESSNIATYAYQLNLFNFRYRWLFFNSRIPFNIKLDFPIYSTNVTFVEIGKAELVMKDQLYSEISTKLYDVVEIVYNMFQFSAKCNTSQIIDSNLGLDTTGKLTINSDMTISRIEWQLIFYAQLNPTIQTGYFLSSNQAVQKTFQPISEKKIESQIINSWNSSKVQIVAFLEPPFVQLVANANQFNTTIEKLEGYNIDLLYYILRKHNLNFNVILLDSQNDYIAVWKSITNDLVSGSFDIAANFYQDISLDNQFTNSFAKRPASIIYRKNLQATVSQAFNIIFPFDGWLWLAIFGSIILISITLTLINYLNPNRQKFSFNESFFFSLSSILQNLSSKPPNKSSGRIIALTFWIFCLAICLTYLCNYGSIIINNIVNTDAISDFNSLLNSPNYIFGTVKNSIYQKKLQANSAAALSKMYDRMQTYPDWLVSTPQKGIDRVNQGNYAFIYHSSTNEYATSQHCGLVNTMHFDSFEEKFLVQQSAPWVDLFNQWLEDAVANNVVTNNYAKYFGDAPYVKCNESVILASLNQYLDFFQYLPFIPKSNLVAQQNFSNMVGIFIVMICGSIIVVVIALLERIVQNVYNKQHLRQRQHHLYKLKKICERSKNPYESFA